MQARNSRTVGFPRSRLATFDIGALSRGRHYVTALLELNVTEARRKIKEKRRAEGAKVSFTGWLLKAIADTIAQHPQVAAFRQGRRRLVVFDDVDVSIVVEKELEGKKVPIPLVIRKANEKTMEAITAEIEGAKAEKLAAGRIVLDRNTSLAERIYYLLPGAVRRLAWRVMMRFPRYVFRKMGSAVFTSVGMMGQVNGWFVQTSIHPISFGAGSVVRKPVVVHDEVRVGEVLHLTVLADHDAVDGAPMARFIAALAENIEEGAGLDDGGGRS